MNENKFTVTCAKCGQKFAVVAPAPGILNDLRVSVLAAPHEKPARCLCGQEYVLIATGGTIDWNLQPLTEEQSELIRGSKIITPTLAVN